MTKDANPPRRYASPPCFAHELADWGGDAAPDGGDAAADVGRWRKAERERLIALRLATPVAERERVAGEIAAELDALVAPRPGVVVSLYWPFRGELDLRGWMRGCVEQGAQTLLPVVEAKGQPLSFREWTPDAPMTRGVWNIPIPADGATLTPNVVIAPLVGVDPGCFRLGYGGGFFDRTLAAMASRPRVIGVGPPAAEIRSIYPQPHDIPMDFVITGAGRVVRRESGA